MSEEITIPSAGTIRTMIANLESACSQVMEQYRRNLDANPDDEMLQEQAETISQFQTTLKRWRIKFQADFEPDPGPGGDPDLTDPEEKRPHVRYVGEIKDNLPDAVYVTTHRPQSVRQDLLDSRLDLQRYAPSGFQWGHPGNGAAQLALAILAHNTENDDYARTYHQEFKKDVISKLPWRGSWSIEAGQVDNWVKDHRLVAPRRLAA